MRMWIQLVSLLVYSSQHALGVLECDSDCTQGFVKFRCSCYFFSADVATFPEAHAFCNFLSSHLAEITTNEENNFIRSYLRKIDDGKGYFIGGTDIRLEGNWTWENPVRKIKYFNWTPKEPNGSGKENCLEVYGIKGWNDIPCRNVNRFIFKKDM